MTAVAALVVAIGLASLLAGVALGWYLRRTNDWCAHCGAQLGCDACGSKAAWPKPSSTELEFSGLPRVRAEGSPALQSRL